MSCPDERSIGRPAAAGSTTTNNGSTTTVSGSALRGFVTSSVRRLRLLKTVHLTTNYYRYLSVLYVFCVVCLCRHDQLRTRSPCGFCAHRGPNGRQSSPYSSRNASPLRCSLLSKSSHFSSMAASKSSSYASSSTVSVTATGLRPARVRVAVERVECQCRDRLQGCPRGVFGPTTESRRNNNTVSNVISAPR